MNNKNGMSNMQIFPLTSQHVQTGYIGTATLPKQPYNTIHAPFCAARDICDGREKQRSHKYVAQNCATLSLKNCTPRPSSRLCNATNENGWGLRLNVPCRGTELRNFVREKCRDLSKNSHTQNKIDTSRATHKKGMDSVNPFTC